MRYRINFRAFSIILAFMIIGCASDRESHHYFKIEEIDGVLTAINTGGPKYSEELFEYEEIVRLEQDESNPESILYRFSQYAMGGDGCYYVVDRGNHRVAVFGPDGRYLRSFGREGVGPGEFRFPMLLWLHDDTVAVFDGENQRTSLFNIDGTLISTFSYLYSRAKRELHPAENDHMVVISYEGSYPDEDITERFWATIVTSRRDTVAQIEADLNHLGWRIFSENPRFAVEAPIFYGNDSRVTYHPDRGILVYNTSQPEFRWYGLDGTLNRIVRIDKEPEMVTAGERRAIDRVLSQSITEATDTRERAIARAVKSNAVVPEFKSFWATVTVDDLGYYWLLKHPDYRLEEPARSNRSYALLSPAGEYLGDTTVPERKIIFSRGHLLSFHEDTETGLLTPVVYRILPVVEGLDYP